jgi:mannose/cellobiose epimerase-like protein (N-acyl-D-glucosamine 2-epimerase family)
VYFQKDYNLFKLEIISKRNYRKHPTLYRWKMTLLNGQWINKEVRGKELKNFQKQMKIITVYQILCATKTILRNFVASITLKKSE